MGSLNLPCKDQPCYHAAAHTSSIKTVQVQTWCIHEQNVFILKHLSALKSFVAVLQAVTNVHPDKETMNKTIHQLVTKLQDPECICNWKHVWS
jgi:putative NADH-flavin reductase